MADMMSLITETLSHCAIYNKKLVSAWSPHAIPLAHLTFIFQLVKNSGLVTPIISACHTEVGDGHIPGG
jgi:hypothetical protein